MDRPRSLVHRIVSALGQALHALGTRPDPLDLERWGFAIHGALAAPGRVFHSHDHVLGIAAGDDRDPLDVIAALYHDAVYIQVDRGTPPSMRGDLDPLFAVERNGCRVMAPPTQATADVLAVFGRVPGDVVDPMTGLNELASALIAAIHMSDVLDRWQRLRIAMSIEQTVAFRDDPATPLHARGALLGVPADTLAELVRHAVRFGNHDVDNFSDPDPGRFLDNTWKLLPESNPALHAPSVYSVRDYRIALQKMEGFLAQLPAERVFHQWGGEPSDEVHATRIARTAHNLSLAVRYLRAKLYSIAIVEALSEVTGGGVPLDYLMGGFTPGEPGPLRIENFLPPTEPRGDLEPLLHALLAQGRASPSSFDTGPSPLAAFLHARCGEAALGRGLQRARGVWSGATTPRDFLFGEPAMPIAAIARAAAEIVDTRAVALRDLADRLDH